MDEQKTDGSISTFEKNKNTVKRMQQERKNLPISKAE
jgi:hypothetical protein